MLPERSKGSRVADSNTRKLLEVDRGRPGTSHLLDDGLQLGLAHLAFRTMIALAPIGRRRRAKVYVCGGFACTVPCVGTSQCTAIHELMDRFWWMPAGRTFCVSTQLAAILGLYDRNNPKMTPLLAQSLTADLVAHCCDHLS